MSKEKYKAPDLSHMSTNDLCALMFATATSNDKSDKDFAMACRDEIAKRKPEKKAAGVSA